MGVTVLLTATSDGKRRLPLVIFQGKGCTKEAKLLKARRDVLVYYNEKGWMDDAVAEFWINKMFNDFERCYKRLLIWDAFRAHISGHTKAVLKRKKIDHAVIPGGCTGLIQTADVSWNRPFKCKLIKLYNTWIENGEKSFTKQNNVRACSKTQLVEMVLESWRSLDEEMICKSFFACGQAKTARPEDITCLKQGHPGEGAFDLVAQGWDIAPDILEIPEVEVDTNQDIGVDKAPEVESQQIEKNDKTPEEVERQHFETNISPKSAPLYDDEALQEASLETEAFPEATLEIEALPLARRLSYDNRYDPKNCSSCEDNSEAKFRCEECQDTLCNTCHDAHLKVKLTRNHTIIPLDRTDGQMEAKTDSSPSSSSSSLPPGQMEFLIRKKMLAILSSSDSD